MSSHLARASEFVDALDDFAKCAIGAAVGRPTSTRKFGFVMSAASFKPVTQWL